jgi:hypothetical protein
MKLLKGLKIATRFKIVGTEVVGLGAFLLIVLGLELRAGRSDVLLHTFGWDYMIIGITLILVGLEILSLIKYLPASKRLQTIESRA